MVSIKNKSGETISATSLNGLMRELGLEGVRNSKAHLQVLKNNEFDLTTLTGVNFDIETLTTTTTRTRSTSSLIERLEKLASTVDKEAIALKQKEADELFIIASTVEHLQEYKALIAEVEKLKNPVADLNSIIAYITKEYEALIEKRADALDKEEDA